MGQSGAISTCQDFVNVLPMGRTGQYVPRRGVPFWSHSSETQYIKNRWPSSAKSPFRVDLIEDIGRKTSKQSLMQLQKEQAAAAAPKPKLRAAFGVANKPKMLGLVKKAGKLQRLNCLEAERVLFVLDQFKSRLLLFWR